MAEAPAIPSNTVCNFIIPAFMVYMRLKVHIIWEMPFSPIGKRNRPMLYFYKRCLKIKKDRTAWFSLFYINKNNFYLFSSVATKSCTNFATAAIRLGFNT
jgi:hypothetical protein